MKDWANWLKVGLLLVAVGGWVAYAEDTHQQTRSNAEQVQLLTTIEAKKQSAAEAKIAQLRLLCRQKKLDPESDICLALPPEDESE